jgi:hypothetical protein
MLRFAFPAVLTALLVQLAGARAADADKDAKAIVAKAIEAKGGAANLEKYKASTSKFTGKVSINDMEVKMSGTAKDQAPDKSRLDASMDLNGQVVPFTQILNGKKGWQGIAGNVDEMDKDALAEALEQNYASQLTDMRGLNGPGIKLKALGESKVDGKTVVGVRASSEGHRDLSLFFSKDDGLLVKTEGKGKDTMGGGEFNAESIFSDYKDAGGLKVAHKVKVLRDGKPFLQMQLTEVNLAEKLPEKDFANPSSTEKPAK